MDRPRVDRARDGRPWSIRLQRRRERWQHLELRAFCPVALGWAITSVEAA